MRIVLYLLSFIALSNSNHLMAQGLCGQTAYLTYLETLNHGFIEAAENTFFTALRESKIKTKRQQDTVFKINVVFHIVYNTAQQNIDDSLVYSQLRIMNEAFRRTNADTTNTREIFKPFAADAGIEFVIARQDPDGNPSTGIIRKETTRGTFGTNPIDISVADLVKNGNMGSTPWDTDKYLNIWICDLSFGGIEGLLGYAYPPTGSANWAGDISFSSSDNQGVVCHYTIVGENNPLSSATGSKTMVHEVGHYLGLRHIWGDGGCAVDDFMDDTPLSGRANSICNKRINTCNEIVGDDFPDMLENYMDYANEACQNLFTNDQVAHMRTNLRMFRSGIYVEQHNAEADLDLTGVYPNPVVEGKLTIYLKNVDVNDTYDMTLYNLLGQPILVWNLEAVSNQQIIGFLGLQGAYIFKIRQGGEQIATGKLLMGQ